MAKNKRNDNHGELAKTLLRLRVNGETHEVASEINKTLLEVLREDMALTGTKHGWELGECGTCAVLADGKPVLSCLLLGIEAVKSEIITVEGMMQKGKPHALQNAFADLGAAQCGPQRPNRKNPKVSARRERRVTQIVRTSTPITRISQRTKQEMPFAVKLTPHAHRLTPISSLDARS